MALGRFCAVHMAPLADDSDLCPRGHVASVIKHNPVDPKTDPRMAPKKEEPVSLRPTPIEPRGAPVPPAPRKFIDDGGQVMVLRVKETKANGWVLHCAISKATTVGKKTKYKIERQGTTRVYGQERTACFTEFDRICREQEMAGWRKAPLHPVKFMEIPAPVVKKR